jgi:DNA-directed RNA polymerase specialized sigma24 family protein
MMDFDDFFRCEQDALLRYCWLLTLEREEASDIAQETMARAWSSWPQISAAGSNPAAWTRTVAGNLARSRWRRLRLAAIRGGGDRSTAAPAVPLADPSLAGALARLSPRQRQVVVLRYWADLRLADCATEMGVTVGAAKQHLARAHDRLGGLIDPTTIEELTL